jgi:hypothetical protein
MPLNFSFGQDMVTRQIWNLSIFRSEIQGYSEYQNHREFHKLSKECGNSEL